jgi:hypothetical protein
LEMERCERSEKISFFGLLKEALLTSVFPFTHSRGK